MRNQELRWAERVVVDALQEAALEISVLICDHSAIAAIRKAANEISARFQRGGKVYSFGNGGSMCDAMLHFAFHADRAPARGDVGA